MKLASPCSHQAAAPFASKSICPNCLDAWMLLIGEKSGLGGGFDQLKDLIRSNPFQLLDLPPGQRTSISVATAFSPKTEVEP